MTINFYLRYHTVFGEELFISGNNSYLGDNDPSRAVKLSWLNEDFWKASILFPDDFDDTIYYKYILKDREGVFIFDGEPNRFIELSSKKLKPCRVIDTWNPASHPGNIFFAKAFRNVLLPEVAQFKKKTLRKINHEFRVKAPLLKPDETICVCGSTKNFRNWNTEDPILLTAEDTWYIARIFLEENEWPATYKYGIYNLKQRRFIGYEQGENRVIQNFEVEKGVTIINDGFINYPFTTWKGAGVSIPVFSLRSRKSFGIGEFTDIGLLVDWAVKAGFKLIQLLPINDTIAHYDWRDSYPYAAISAFALHPIYINLEKVAGNQHAYLIKPLMKKQKQLNGLKEVDYVEVLQLKLSALKQLYKATKEDFKNDINYFGFFDLNRDWLVPYAVFSYLRDKYKTPDFSKWKKHKTYSESDVQKLASPAQKHYDEIAFFYFVQYHLHLQLKDVTDYAHRQQIVLKGDIPIGVYRHGCDAWMNPRLFNMDEQTGAPPDSFAIKGQNWSFPTYNWNEMSKNDFNWWRRRLEQKSNYFDAYRIDHILGFFRTWSIPVNAVEGIMGRFVPAIPVDVDEFSYRNIWFDYDRYCKPYITSQVIEQIFEVRADEVKKKYLDIISNDNYGLKDFINTQEKVAAHFGKKDKAMKQGLFDLISNVILFEEKDSDQRKFHFRISIDQTSSFQLLDDYTKHNLWELYVNYFFERQNDFWKRDSLKKLPQLKRSTNMLVFGEDLGMVPPCVPGVMKQLGILSLEVERMPKQLGSEFFHPNDAPYLSVVTPSTHDMSTIRGWWQEDREKTQRFYNYMLGQYGEAPVDCEGWINKRIVLQHLYSPAMWSIFLLADLLGVDENIRREKAEEERINVPPDPHHHWNYRMHINFEDLLKKKEFNEDIRKIIEESGRIPPTPKGGRPVTVKGK